MKKVTQEIETISENFDSHEIIHRKTVYDRLLIIGSDQSGKTALAKIIYMSFYDENLLPLYINSENIKTTVIEKALKKEIKQQYENCEWNDYFKSIRKRVAILDNFELIKLNEKYQDRFLKNLERYFEEIIILSDDSIRFNESQYIELSAYNQFDIMPFNNSKRGELIEKWNSLGQEETINIKRLYDNNDEITYKINGIIQKNILPPKPIYILTIIQTLDTSKSGDYTLTSYGHCYQLLIQKNLNATNIKADEFDQFINYLSEIAYFIFKSKKEYIDKEEYSIFKREYSSKYILDSHDYILDILIRSELMKEIEGKYRFSYKYIFYFYVAKYISEHLDNDICKLDIENLCRNLHTEKNSNIIIFLVHHSKDQIIIDEIMLHASIIFDNYLPATLNASETEYLEKFVRNLPDLVIKQKNIEKQRKSRLLKKDIADSIDSESEPEVDDKIEEDEIIVSEEDRVFADVNSSVRITEIIGQILRNRHGSLTKKQLKELTLTGYDAGLKFLNFFIKETEQEQEQIILKIQDLIANNEGISKEEITKEARNFFLFICYTTIYSVLNKISTSVGTPKLMAVFEEIKHDNPESSAIDLLLISIHLEFNKEIPKKEIVSFFEKHKNNEINKRLLKEIVIQFLYLNPVEYRDRQWISSKLELPIETQRKLQEQFSPTKTLSPVE